MDKIVNRYQAVCATVWIIVFCIVAALWPLRLIDEKIVSGSNRQISMQSEAITEEYVVMQMFVAQYDHLQNIKVYLLNESAGEEFNFSVFDASMNRIMQQVIRTDDMEEMPGFCRIQVNLDTEVGREYYYAIQGLSTDFYVAFEDTETSGTIYNGTSFYGTVEDTEHNIITEYEYRVPLRKGKTLLCDVLLVLFGISVTLCAKRYYTRHPDRNVLTTVESVWKKTAGTITAVAAFAGTIAIWPLQLFARDYENNLFLGAGCMAASGILFYGIFHKRKHKSHDMGWAVLCDRWPDYLQAAFFALAIQAGVHYVNGLYEIHHMIAYREMLIWFGLAVIATYTKKEAFHLANMLYLAAAAVVGFSYYQRETASLYDAEEIQVVKLTVWAGIVAGIVILNTVVALMKGQLLQKLARTASPVYGIILALFFGLMLAFRNTRGWVVYLVCAFALYYLRVAVWEKRDRLPGNICNGILLHFLVAAGYCLLHRPYMFFYYYRYPFVFHTVTITAVYLSLVVVAALVKFLHAYGRERSLSNVWKELVLFGLSMAYLIFTLSRTGYLAILAAMLITVPFACFRMRRKIRSFFVAAAMLTLSVLLCFPVAYTAQRTIPAVAAQPHTFAIEELPSEIEHGRDMDSKYYMTVRRFIQIFEMKILGIPEEECISLFMAEEEGRNIPDRMLVASADFSGGEIPAQEGEQSGSDVEEYANGRLEIFRLYYHNLNREGHDDMGILLPNGVLIAHAHNIYLQAAYDFGVPVGIVFILFGLATIVQAGIYYGKRREQSDCCLLPFTLLLVFAVAGLTEWIFHPCNPLAFCLLLSLAPLLFDMGKRRERNV